MRRSTLRSRLLAAAAAIAVVAGLVPAGQVAHAATNLGLNRTVTASGHEGAFTPERAFDGDAGPADPTPPTVHNDPAASRWSAGTNDGDNAWIAVDFGAPAALESVQIRWGNTFATSYSLQGSADGSSWTDLRTGLAGVRADWSDVDLQASGVRHLKLQIQGKSQTWPLSVWEIQAMGTLEGPVVEPLSLPVVPRPAMAQDSGLGDFALDAGVTIAADGDAVPTAEAFAAILRRSTGYALPVGADGEVSFVLDAQADLPAEGYSLVSGADGVAVTAATEAGLFYGAQTLLQLLGPWSRSAGAVAADWTVPGAEIQDSPRYEWRGFMLDMSRSHFPVEEVKQMIDQMAYYKLNVLHLHLADDQGWRIAISNQNKVAGDDIDYSLLTSISGNTAVATTQWTDLPGRTGFYTADDFAEIVRYAADRHIATVPEVDGPAHSNAILHAIPQLNSANSYPKLAPGETTTPVNTTTSVGESSLDARNEKTYTFLTHVLRELVAANSTDLHGEKYLHLGGDESHNTSLADYRTYMDRSTDIVTDLGAHPVVWNEGANNAADLLPAGTIIQHWIGGVSQSAKDLVANKDGRLLLSPANRAYLPQVPGPGIVGPTWACGGPCGIDAFYNWNPTAYAGVPEAGVIGVEAPIWAEHLRSLTSAEYLMYPRLMATAEVGWTPQDQRNLADFRERLAGIGNALSVEGRNFYPGDATWSPTLATLVQDEVTADDEVGDIALASVPDAEVAGVTATLELAGQAVPVTVSVDRPKLDSATKFDGRQVNGLFRFSVDQALEPGTHTGTLSVTAKGQTLSTTVSIDVETEPEPTVEPSEEPTVEPSEEPTVEPTVEPSEEPTVEPTVEPSEDPTAEPSPQPTARPVDVYSTPGLHYVSGRHWWTECEPYSVTQRCLTRIWATSAKLEGGVIVKENGWVFNNLTYLPSPRAAWASNPLGNEGRWTAADGRQWMTDCDSPVTGRNGCRSYTISTVVQATPAETGWTYAVVNKWVLNNIVRFS